MCDNNFMNAATATTDCCSDLIPDELDADTQAVIQKLLTAIPLDLETYRRIREQADHVRDELFQRYGVLEIGVPAIRDLRDGNRE